MRFVSVLSSIVIVHALLESGVFAAVTTEDIKLWKVTVTPRVQKVAEGSTVVFTCESSLPVNVRFQWTKSTKPIEKKDSIEIIQIAHNLSVLRIEKAHLRKHRRAFRCTAFYDDPETQSVLDRIADATLKVISNKKIPKNFPKVTSRVYEELLETRPGYIPLVCDIEGFWSKSFPLYTWYKDSVINLSFQEKNWENDGMRILYVEPSQANGTFQCAAFYKKGSVTAYGNVIPADNIASHIKGGCTDYNGTMVGHGDMFYRSACEHCECRNGDVGFCALTDCIPAPPGCFAKEGGACCDYACEDYSTDVMMTCIDYNGQTVKDGETYRRGSNPCETCLCSGAEATLCAEAFCDAPPCQNYNLIPDTCCGFECLDCASYDGTWVEEGDSYAPTSDPCETCVCNKGNPAYCFNVACMKPEMECPEPMPIPGECCKFTCDKYPRLNETVLRIKECVSFNGTSVPEGQKYKPGSDACETCTCHEGNPEYCMVVACMPPRNCRNPQPKPGVCCQFNCGESVAFREKECVSFNGTSVPEGQRYKPGSDACKTCTCHMGEPKYCMVVACMPPRNCKNPQPKPGVCCQFNCGESVAFREKGCKAYNGTIVPEGYMFSPERDACKQCTCMDGSPKYCMSAGCLAPPMPCDDPTPVPGVCCQFTCNRTVAMTTRGCKAYNGTIVPEGYMYSPERDACKQCTCMDGSPKYCINVGCLAPPMSCDDPMPVPGVCCQFTCNRTVAMNTRACMSHNGTKVPYGARYQPSDNPCRICECSESDSVCMMVRCAMPQMPCPNPSRVPNECCSFTCNITMTRPAVPVFSGDDSQSVRIRPFVQQIGPQAVMIHWEIPDMGRFSDVRDISMSISGHDYYGHFDGQRGVDHLIVRGLNQSVEYEVFGYARVTSRDPKDERIPKYIEKVNFMLDAKATASLNLRHAIGEVYESRGAINRGSYSLPQPFERVMVDNNFQVTINLNTFNRVEMSTYMANPCSKAECGLLRFYMYNMTGHAHNVMSLMFIEDMDFDWAMAHL